MSLFVFADRVLREITDLPVSFFSLPDVGRELRGLEDLIRIIQDFLLDAEDKAVSNELVRDWVNRLEDVLHDADDLMGELQAEGLRRRVMQSQSGDKVITKVRSNVVFSSPSQLVFGLKMSRKIRRIRHKIVEVTADKRPFLLEERMDVTLLPAERHRRTYSIAVEEQVFGREKDKEKIIKWLVDVDSEERVSVLPIVGMGGLGKTTLAQLVYNDEVVESSFELRAWCFIGDNFYLERIMESLLLHMGKFLPQNPNLELLVDQLRETVRGKRYLLVLDDLWSEDPHKWLMLMAILGSKAGKGGKIIVTTRSHTVADIVRTMTPYQLAPLDEGASWSLFKGIAFAGGHEPDDLRITKIAEVFVRKCCGNPLAIRAIGRMLFFRKPEEWASLPLDTEFSEVLRHGDDNVMETLRLSYKHLPPRLKTCFAYCRLFPKGYEIDVQTLVGFWISQGLIHSSTGDIEEEGYEYFLDLLQRSFFHEPKTGEWGNITKCKMQNLLHDLALSVAETRFVTFELKTDGEKCDQETHHVSFDFHLDSPWQIPTDLVQAKKIRTIILTRQSQWEFKGRSSNSICDVIALKLKRLRMLDLHNSGIKVVPESIGELKLLKYLDLSQNKDIEVLPRSFCGLLNLHTLKLNDCGRLQELPRKIRKLINLRRLEIDSCYSLTHMPRGLGQLTNLRRLSEFILSRGDSSSGRRVAELDELAMLNNLTGQLRIKNLRPERNSATRRSNEREDTDVPAKVLKQKSGLQSVMLIWDTATTPDNQARIMASDYKTSLDGLEPHPDLLEMSISAYGGTMFSEWLASHENLVKLSLSKCMNCEHLPLLNRLTQLKVLVLDEMANLKYISDYLKYISDNIDNPPTAVYPSLKELRLTNLPKLDRWWKLPAAAEETTFPHLSKLIIEDCPNLNSMPLFPALEELLLLKNTRWELFQHTVRGQQIATRTTAAEVSSSLSSSSTNLKLDYPLSKLRTLSIIQMSNVDTDMWQYLESLRSLTLDHLPNVKTLLERLPHEISLQELHILRSDSLSEITPWINDLTSLRKLYIRLCPSLTIPVDHVGLITSLQNVEIEDCPKIVHVENLLKDRILRR